ncbi:MAG: hypothetical protein ACREUB_08560 [Burkholderiales bacterium]
MNTRQNAKSGSTLEQQIQSINMSQFERDQVLHAARVAEAFVDAIMWVGSKLQRSGGEVFAKPSPKY